MASKKKPTKEVIAVAEEIASVVEPAPPSIEQVSKESKPIEEAKPAPVKVATIAPKAPPPKSMKVKAVSSARGQFHSIRYEIEAGKVYTLRTDLAEWLISVGRAI